MVKKRCPADDIAELRQGSDAIRNFRRPYAVGLPDQQVTTSEQVHRILRRSGYVTSSQAGELASEVVAWLRTPEVQDQLRHEGIIT